MTLVTMIRTPASFPFFYPSLSHPVSGLVDYTFWTDLVP